MLVPIFIRIGRYHILASGAVIRDVTCEQCNCQYFYQLSRRIEVHDTSSPDTLPARRRLESSLRRGVDPVACPDCGFLQESMLRGLRNERLSMVFLVTFVLALALITFSLFATGDPSNTLSTIVAWSALAALVGVVATTAAIICRNDNRPDRITHRRAHPVEDAIHRADFPEVLPDELFTAPPK